jgi:hypothetical protein
MRGWIIAFLITLVAASYQRITGPTYPVRGTVALSGNQIPYRLARSHGGAGDQVISISVPDTGVTGDLVWKRRPTNDPETTTPMRREEDRLVGELPHQPPAGKLEYRVQLHRGEDTVSIPESGPAILRFKGGVPHAVLIPHIVLMFCAMLYSNRAMIEVFQKRRNLPHYALGTATMLLLGGLVLGPIVQKYAFGQWWTGVPFGYDLTDNKTLIAFVVWVLAGAFVRRPRLDRVAIFIAAAVTLIVFAIPHSTWGSEYKYGVGRAGSGATFR